MLYKVKYVTGKQSRIETKIQIVEADDLMENNEQDIEKQLRKIVASSEGSSNIKITSITPL